MVLEKAYLLQRMIIRTLLHNIDKEFDFYWGWGQGRLGVPKAGGMASSEDTSM